VVRHNFWDWTLKSRIRKTGESASYFLKNVTIGTYFGEVGRALVRLEAQRGLDKLVYARLTVLLHEASKLSFASKPRTRLFCTAPIKAEEPGLAT
jgi:hypothetical protein